MERAVAIQPDYTEGLNNLGLIWQARKDFTRGAALAPVEPWRCGPTTPKP